MPVSLPSKRAAPLRPPPADDAGAPSRQALVWLGAAVVCVLAFVLGMMLVWTNPLKPTPAAAPTVWDADGGPVIIPVDRPRQLVDFALTDQRGRTVRRADLNGKIVAVSFLFTSCGVVCPYVSAQMEKIQQADLPNVRLLSITYDPVDDTPSVLATFARGFNANPERWSFLTGDLGTVRTLIKTSFLDEYRGEFAFPGLFANTQRIALVDPQGKLVSYFDGLNDKAGDAVIARIRQMEPAP